MAITVYRNTDRINLRINDVNFILKPLSYREKSIISGAITNTGGEQRQNAINGLTSIMKFSIKGVEGINYLDGTPLALEFDDDGYLKDSSIDELLNLAITPDLTTALYQLLQGIPTEIKGIDGEILSHISIAPIMGVSKKN
jgi:hypothetical protein